MKALVVACQCEKRNSIQSIKPYLIGLVKIRAKHGRKASQTFFKLLHVTGRARAFHNSVFQFQKSLFTGRASLSCLQKWLVTSECILARSPVKLGHGATWGASCSLHSLPRAGVWYLQTKQVSERVWSDMRKGKESWSLCLNELEIYK